MTRLDFLKGSVFGVLALGLAAKTGLAPVYAGAVNDNLTKTGNHVGSTPPVSTTMTWTDTSDSGVMKYWNGSKWTPIRSTWDA